MLWFWCWVIVGKRKANNKVEVSLFLFFVFFCETLARWKLFIYLQQSYVVWRVLVLGISCVVVLVFNGCDKRRRQQWDQSKFFSFLFVFFVKLTTWKSPFVIWGICLNWFLFFARTFFLKSGIVTWCLKYLFEKATQCCCSTFFCKLLLVK